MARSQTAAEVANERVNAVINPQLDAIARAQAAADAQAAAAWQRQQEAIAGYAQAAAALVGPTGGQIQQGYADAGQRTANYAKGFSIGFNQAVTGNADAANALLAKQGSPQQVASQGAPGADVIYGTGGYIPAQGMEREGAAWGAYGRTLPSTQLGYGSQRLAQGQAQYAADAAARRAEYENLRKDVLGSRAELYDRARQQILENNMARQKFAEDKRAALANEKTTRDAAKTQADYLKNAQRSQALQEASYLTNQNGNLYYVDQNGQVQLARDKKGNPIPATGSDSYAQVAAASAKAAGTKGKTKDARTKALANRANALTTASGTVRSTAQDFVGNPIKNPQPDSFRNPGIYLDANGKGTNDPKKAAREGGTPYAQAFQQVMALEEVQQLMTRYGMSRTKVRAKVNAWLRSIGITPKPKRTKPKVPRISEGARNSPH